MWKSSKNTTSSAWLLQKVGRAGLALVVMGSREVNRMCLGEQCYSCCAWLAAFYIYTGFYRGCCYWRRWRSSAWVPPIAWLKHQESSGKSNSQHHWLKISLKKLHRLSNLKTDQQSRPGTSRVHWYFCFFFGIFGRPCRHSRSEITISTISIFHSVSADMCNHRFTLTPIKAVIAKARAISQFLYLCSGLVQIRFMAAELIRLEFYIVCAGWVWRLRSDKAMENPRLERKRGEQGLALSFCTGASCWPGQPEGCPQPSERIMLNSLLCPPLCMETKCWQ